MREVPSTIWNLWDNGGPYIGEDGAPHTRVTVEPDWSLHTTRTAAGNYHKLPVRWWQRKNNSQVEVEVPNIRMVDIDRSLDTDGARCHIALDNQWHFQNGEITTDGELGQPGYFTFSRGDSSESLARWGQQQNDWNGVLIPNALLRTYQGYGGTTKSVEDAIADGNILLTGVWLIDTVSVNTDGSISLQCRDMAKLLIDQFIFPPLTPHGWYPLTYCRWYFDRGSTPQVLYGHKVEDGYLRANSARYVASSGDEDGSNDLVLGHRPTHALDQFGPSYWLSIGRGAATEWVYYELTVSEAINVFFVEGQLGGYQVYVSVMENGVWQGASSIPAPPGYNERYIMQMGADQFDNASAILDRIYQAQRVRFTFTHLRRTDLEGVTYRVAAQEISIGRIESGLPTKTITSMTPGPNNQGYWLVGNDGGVFTLGRGLRFFGSSGGGSTSVQWVGIASKPDGSGYWTARADGRVYAFGGAQFYGDARGASLAGPIMDMGITPQGTGYWLLGADGGIFSYGNAGFHGNGVGAHTGLAMAFAERPQGDGYWILWNDGHVTARGNAVSHGNANVSTTATGIVSTKSGNGYWIVSEEGSVFAFGDADYHGGANNLTLADPVTDIVRTTTAAGNGYYLVAGDGGIFAYGDAHFWGSLPGDFSWSVRKDGNYKDYTDIIKDLLLWSGWLLYDPALPGSSKPDVFGNIETTGIYDSSLSSGSAAAGTGEGCLPEDVFDKKPVIDAINQLKEIVGFNFWIDEEGGARFELPNWYVSGNRIMDDGSHTTFVPVIDESSNLIDYSIDYTDAPVRSEIIIASADPDEHLSDTKTSRLTVSEMAPESTELLRGMVKPAMWVNETFQNQKELDVMAKRVATQILFNQRIANVTCAFNPAIQINDQVQIYERQTSETYVHYVRGVRINHDLPSGKLTMQLTTHWLGSGSRLIIAAWGTP